MHKLKKIAGSVLAASMIGCAIATVDKNFSTINSDVAILVTDLQTATTDISAAMSHTDPAGKISLQSALDAIKDASKNTDPITAANGKWKADYSALKADDDRVRSSWGWRLEQLCIAFFWTTIAICIVVVIGIPILYSFFGADLNFFGAILRQLHAALPAQNLGNWINSIRGKVVAAIPATPPAPTPLPVSIVGKASPVNSGTVAPATALYLSTPADAGTIDTEGK